MTKESTVTLFDLNPPVDHLMADIETVEPFDRAATTAWRTEMTNRPLGARGPVERARHALGTRLIAVGQALTLEERGVRTSAVR